VLFTRAYRNLQRACTGGIVVAVMPNTTSAKKALRASNRKRVFNDRRKFVMRERIKTLKKTVASGDNAGAQALLSETYKAIDKAQKRGVIKKNTASRKKSQLARTIQAISK
jgi:small subunit ribosomal protein S20